MLVAERIRKAIGGCAFRIGESSEEVEVTASLGLSVYPDDARSSEELVPCPPNSEQRRNVFEACCGLCLS
jgi:GGDEF domain-containing protein